ncbi:MAG: polynucleotide kinase-phosphatase, partial [Mesorhizobium sp.]
FGILGDETGAIWTRTGRCFFNDSATTEGLLARLRASVEAADLWKELNSDWLLLDTEIMPWSAKASSLIESQYSPVATSSAAGFQASREALARAMARGVDATALDARLDDRAARAAKYATAWAPYVWPVSGIDDLKV